MNPSDFKTPNVFESGWLSPKGEMFWCPTMFHDSAARVIARTVGWVGWLDTAVEGADPGLVASEVDACEFLTRLNWVRCYGNADETLRWATGIKLKPTFEQRQELIKMGYNPDAGSCFDAGWNE